MNFWNLLGLPSKQDYNTLQEVLRGQSLQFQELSEQFEKQICSLNDQQSNLLKQSMEGLSLKIEESEAKQENALKTELSHQKQSIQTLCLDARKDVLSEVRENQAEQQAKCVEILTFLNRIETKRSQDYSVVLQHLNEYDKRIGESQCEQLEQMDMFRHSLEAEQQKYYSEILKSINQAETKREQDYSVVLQHLAEHNKHVEESQREQLKQLDMAKCALEEVQHRQRENSTLLLNCFAEQDKKFYENGEFLRTGQRNLLKTQIETLGEIDSLFKMLKSIWINELSSYMETLSNT